MKIRRRERRPPATLRTKTGCTNCRSRRRKCDEQHPSCFACSKRQLECTWPRSCSPAGHRHAAPRSSASASASASSPTSPRPAPVPIRPRPDSPVGPPSPRSMFLEHLSPHPLHIDVDQGLLNHYSSRLCSMLLNRHAHPGFQRSFLQSSVLPKLQLMVEPLLACASLDLSRQFPEYRPLALKYYARAVTNTRDTIARRRVQGTEDWLLLNVMHLNLFETWNASGRGAPVLLHIQGAARILKLKGMALEDLRSTSDKVFARIAAEAFVYHTFSWSIFNGNPIPMPAAELWDCLEPFLALRPFPDASDVENSPVLGVPWQLYHFLSDMTQLSHSRPLDAAASQTLAALKLSLDAWESANLLDVDSLPAAAPSSSPSSSSPSSSSFRHRQRARLFVLALRILIIKFTRPDASTADPLIQRHVLEATQLAQLPILERIDFWPLLVVGSAVLHRDKVDIIRNTLRNMARTMNSVAFVKTTRALETIWAKTAAGQDGQDGQACDGLTMLLGGGSAAPGLIHCDVPLADLA